MISAPGDTQPPPVKRSERKSRWEQRRTRSIARIRYLGLGLAGAAVFTLMAFVLEPRFGGGLTDFVLRTVFAIPVIGNLAQTLVESTGLKEAARPVVLPLSALAGWLITVPFMARPARAIHERFFAEYDEGRLHPIRHPQPDPASHWAGPMPFQRPSGEWHHHWNRLTELLNRGTGTGRTPWWKPWGKPDLPTPFDAVLLLGPSGAGKSRVIQELARQLGQRHLLGSTALASQPPAEQQAAARLRRRTRRRRLAWWRSRRSDDLWDSGRIDPNDLADLADWLPARPTVLWLDDPAPGETTACLKALRMRQSRFRHPVRLVIANQTVPRDLVDAGGPEVPMIVLGSGGFTSAVIFALADALLGQKAKQLREPTVLERFLEVTERNPLLVELGLEWLKDDRPLAEMSREGLLEHRVRRIVRALEVAKVAVDDMDTMRALACGILVGPGCPIAPVAQAFNQRIPPRDILERAFPVEARRGVDLAQTLPGLRPALIADRFVRFVIERQTPKGSALAISRVGFIARPLGWVRAAARLAGANDALAEALRTPPAVPGHDVETIALMAHAYLEIGLAGERPAAEIHGLIDGLLAQIADERSCADVARRLLTTFVDAVERGGVNPPSRPESSQTIDMTDTPSDASFDKGLSRVEAPTVALLGVMLARHGARGSGAVETVARLVPDCNHLITLIRQCLPPISAAAEAPAFARELDALASLSMTLPPLDQIGVITVASHLAATGEFSGPVLESVRRLIDTGIRIAPASNRRSLLKALQNWAFVLGEARHPDECQGVVNLAAEIFGSESDQTTAAHREDLVLAYQHLAYVYSLASDTVSCRKCVEHMAKIVHQSSDPDLMPELIKGWLFLAFAYVINTKVPECEEIVQAINAVVNQAPYRAMRACHLALANGRRFLVSAYSQTGDAAKCEAMVSEVVAMVDYPPYDTDREFLLEGVRARCLLAFVYSEQRDAAYCRVVLERNERIVGSVPYLTDWQFQEQRATGWRHLAYAHSKAGKIAECRTAVATVEATGKGARFWMHRSFVAERAKAWCMLAYAYSEGVDPVRCKEVVDTIEREAGRPPYSEDPEIVLESAEAYRHLAFAYGRAGDLVACQGALHTLETMIDRLSGSAAPKLMLEWVRATRSLALGYSLQHDAQRCHEAVTAVEAAITRTKATVDLTSHDAQRPFVLEAARAWCHAALAHALTSDPTLCRDAIKHLDAWAAHKLYRSDDAIVAERVQARRFLAYALGDNASAIRDVVTEMREIAAGTGEQWSGEIRREIARALVALARALRNDWKQHASVVAQLEALARTTDPSSDVWATLQQDVANARSFAPPPPDSTEEDGSPA